MDNSIFISYAREDQAAALSIYELLRTNSFSPWIDCKKLLPGQDWKHEIDHAIRTSQIFISCLSKNSVSKRGYVQSELKKAVKVLDTVPEDDVFLIPVRLDDCNIPQTIAHLHWVDFFSTDGPVILLEAITRFIVEEGASRASEESEHSTYSDTARVSNPYQDRARGLELILDALSTRRAFFTGDERILRDAEAYSQHFRHMWEMLGYLDAGRALVVAHSFAEMTGEMQKALSMLTTAYDTKLKDMLSDLIVLCKNYAEQYRGQLNIGLAHIGWGKNRLFKHQDEKFGFTSDDSVEIYRDFLCYLSRSCEDLALVRSCAKEIATHIGQKESLLRARCLRIAENIDEGIREINNARRHLDRTIEIVGETIIQSTDFDTRLKILTEWPEVEDRQVGALIKAITNVHSNE